MVRIGHKPWMAAFVVGTLFANSSASAVEKYASEAADIILAKKPPAEAVRQQMEILLLHGSELLSTPWDEDLDRVADALVAGARIVANYNASANSSKNCLSPDITALVTGLSSLKYPAKSNTEIGGYASTHHVNTVMKAAVLPFRVKCHSTSKADIDAALSLIEAAQSFQRDSIEAGKGPSKPYDSILRGIRSLAGSIASRRGMDEANLFIEKALGRVENSDNSQVFASYLMEFLQYSSAFHNQPLSEKLTAQFLKLDITAQKNWNGRQLYRLHERVEATTTALAHVGFVDLSTRILEHYAEATKTISAREFEVINEDPDEMSRNDFGARLEFRKATIARCRGDELEPRELYRIAPNSFKGDPGFIQRLAEIAYAQKDYSLAIALADKGRERASKAYFRFPIEPDLLGSIRAMSEAPFLRLQAYSSLRLGYMASANQRFLELAHMMEESGNNGWFGFPVYLSSGRIFLEAGQFNLVQAYIDEAKRLAKAEPSVAFGLENEILALQVELDLRLGKTTEAVQAVHALAESVKNNFRDPSIHYGNIAFVAGIAPFGDPLESQEVVLERAGEEFANNVSLFRIGAFAHALTSEQNAPDDDSHLLLDLALDVQVNKTSEALALARLGGYATSQEKLNKYLDYAATFRQENEYTIVSYAQSTPFMNIEFPLSELPTKSSVPCTSAFSQEWNAALTTMAADIVTDVDDKPLGPKKSDLKERAEIQKQILERRKTLQEEMQANGFLDEVKAATPSTEASGIAKTPNGTVALAYLSFPQFLLIISIRDGKATTHAVPVTSEDLDRLVAPILKTARDPTVEFDYEADEKLSQLLLQPVADELKGVSRVSIVPSGPLEALPFGLLRFHARSDEAKSTWFFDVAALSVSPSLDLALNDLATSSPTKTSLDNRAFLGIGAPLLEGDRYLCGSILKTGLRVINERADTQQLRQLCPIWDTEELIENASKTFNGAKADGRLIGADATEGAVKSLSQSGELRKYSVLMFATHGLMAARPTADHGYVPPGLVLTPPESPTGRDDGYLNSEEISRLNIGADWVVLTACNTASTDGTTRAGTLTGFAKAFMIAGGRSILISHWSVPAHESSLLVQEALSRYARGIEKPFALQEAMRKVESDPSGETRHPYYWAAFSNVGG